MLLKGNEQILRLLFLVAISLGVCCGCGSNAPFDYILVAGKLTYEDGSPLPAEGIVLEFMTLDIGPQKKSHPRPGSSKLNKQGEFTCATSYKYGDGLVPGKHKVAIYYATDKDGKLLVPKEYAHIATTPLTIDTDDTPLDIKVPKP